MSFRRDQYSGPQRPQARMFIQMYVQAIFGPRTTKVYDIIHYAKFVQCECKNISVRNPSFGQFITSF